YRYIPSILSVLANWRGHGSPRRSRTAKTSRVSRHAVKSRCAREWDEWGRLSDDGLGQHNPDSNEGPWGGGLTTLHGGALSSPKIPLDELGSIATKHLGRSNPRPDRVS